jgi:hypothetical protein
MGELPGKESVISALFPSSAWEHTFAKLRFAIHHGKQSFRKMRGQAELGHQEKLALMEPSGHFPCAFARLVNSSGGTSSWCVAIHQELPNGSMTPPLRSP